jgi:hypothetical protein
MYNCGKKPWSQIFSHFPQLIAPCRQTRANTETPTPSRFWGLRPWLESRKSDNTLSSHVMRFLWWFLIEGVCAYQWHYTYSVIMGDSSDPNDSGGWILRCFHHYWNERIIMLLGSYKRDLLQALLSARTTLCFVLTILSKILLQIWLRSSFCVSTHQISTKFFITIAKTKHSVVNINQSFLGIFFHMARTASCFVLSRKLLASQNWGEIVFTVARIKHDVLYAPIKEFVAILLHMPRTTPCFTIKIVQKSFSEI